MDGMENGMKIEKGGGVGERPYREREREKVFLLCISGMASQSITRNFVTTVNCAPDLTPPPPLHRMYLFSPQEGRRKKKIKKKISSPRRLGWKHTNTHTQPLPSPPSRRINGKEKKKERKKRKKTWNLARRKSFNLPNKARTKGGLWRGKSEGPSFWYVNKEGGGFFFSSS